MTQTRLASLYEACFNTGIGFVISFFLSLIVLPAFGLAVTVAQNFWITVIFTVVSIARGYFVRRYFNHKLHLLAQRLAGETK